MWQCEGVSDLDCAGVGLGGEVRGPNDEVEAETDEGLDEQRARRGGQQPAEELLQLGLIESSSGRRRAAPQNQRRRTGKAICLISSPGCGAGSPSSASIIAR